MEYKKGAVYKIVPWRGGSDWYRTNAGLKVAFVMRSSTDDDILIFQTLESNFNYAKNYMIRIRDYGAGLEMMVCRLARGLQNSVDKT